MFFGKLTAQSWEPARGWRIPNTGISRDAAAVLTVTGSLTRFLEQRFGMRLDVRVHDQFVDSASAEEAALLGCPVAAPALRRRVALMHRGSVMFDAESVLPLEGLPADLMQSLQEGKRPLGNLLLDRGLSLARSDLSIARIEHSDRYQGCWARRSVLRSPSGTKALVVEVFHPEIWRRLEHLKLRR